MSTRSLQRRHLEALVAIGDSRSVHRAARDLGLTQPALSRVLAEAERLLGARLFDRSNQGSVPTAEGADLLARARVVLRGLERLGESAERVRAPIRLGSIARAMHALMPALLERVYPPRSVDRGDSRGDNRSDDRGARDGRGAGGGSRARRDAADAAGAASTPPRFRLTEGSSALLLAAVANGDLDFAILRSTGAAPPEADLQVDRLYDERSVVIGAAPLDAPEPLPLARLADRDWVLPDRQTGSRAAFDRFWFEQGLAPVQPVVETRSFETNLALVAKTHFLSIAPESIARRHAARGDVHIVRTRPLLPPSPVTLVSLRAAADDPALADFRSAVLGAARQARAALRDGPR